MTKYKAHPAANLFPMMDTDQFEAFKEDIRKNGFQQDIVIYQGRILDGRNRYKAAVELNMIDDLPVAEMDDDTDIDPYQWVISRNLHRRHLTESQRAMVASKLAKLKRGGDRSKASIDALKQDDAAKLLNVSPASLDRAKTVQRKGSPELIAAVEQGEVAVSKAATIAKTVPKERQLAEAKRPTTSTTKGRSGVTIDSGPLDAAYTFEQTPRDRWHLLAIAKKSFLKTRLRHDCRCLIEFVQEADEAYAELGYASPAEMISEGYELTQDHIEVALRMLELSGQEHCRKVATEYRQQSSGAKT